MKNYLTIFVNRVIFIDNKRRCGGMADTMDPGKRKGAVEFESQIRRIKIH